MAQTPESSFNRAKKFTIFAFGTIRFWLFETLFVTPITIFFLLWQPSWAKGGSSLTYYQVLLPVLGAILGLIIVFLIGLFLAPYHERNELRAKVKQYEQEKNNPKSPYYDEIAKETTNKHWENLAILCEDINSRMTLPFAIDQRYFGLLLDDNDDFEDDGIRTLIFFINHWGEFDYATSPDYIKSNADWGLYKYLQKHLIAEDSDWNNKMENLKGTVKELHKKLHTLSEVANGITSKWQIVLEIDWSSDYAVEAGELSLKMREVIKPMQDEIMIAYSRCWRTIMPIRTKLTDLSKRRTFKGECPACP
jgi:gas vesicle protein